MIVCDIDIPNLTKEGIQLRHVFSKVHELHCSRMID